MNPNSLYVLMIWFFLEVLALPLKAEIWYAPAPKTGQTLQIENLNNTEILATLIPNQAAGQILEEINLTLKPKGSTQVLEDMVPGASLLQIQTIKGDRLRISLQDRGHLSLIPENTSRLAELRPPTLVHEITILNLSSTPQKFVARMSSLDSTKLILENGLLGPFEEKILKLKTPPVWIQLEGDHGLQAWASSSRGMLFFSPQKEPLAPQAPARFLVSDSNRSSSFVIELTSVELIQQARAQIKNPNIFLPRILVAQIAAGAVSFNQDRVHPLRRTWSWHVQNVIKFAELASHSCDANPEFVETYLSPWLDSGLPICMWNYRVIEEL